MMFDRLLNLLSAGGTPGTETPSEQLATALLLIEMASADFEFADVERSRIAGLLAAHFGMDAADVEALIHSAQQRARQSTSLYDYVKVLNERLEPDGKYRIMEMLWRVACADGHVDKYEEHLLRRLADMLYVSESDYVRAKLAAMEG